MDTSRRIILLLTFYLGGVFLSFQTEAQDLESVREKFESGKYLETLELTEKALEFGAWDKDWRMIRIRSAIATGEYELASKESEIILQERRRDLDVRWLARDAFLRAGEPERAEEMIAEIDSLVGRRPWSYQNAKSLVVIGETALALGIDPKLALERFFDVAKKLDSKEKSIYLSTGYLALRKEDYKLASENFQAGFKLYPKDPEFAYGLARSFQVDEPEVAANFLEQALAGNPNHIPSLLMLAENQLDSEDFTKAEEILKSALEINPHHENTWAMMGALHHLQGRYEEEKTSIMQATRLWKNNPEPLFLIGRKLSLNYRFREGSAYQRRALMLKPDYLPALSQLAQDLLRLGNESEGWDLVRQARDQDPYHVTIFNLSQLRSKLDTFTELRRDGVILSMEPSEAQLYGEQALELLVRAKSFFSEKYQVTPPDPIRVEIFPEQKDFAIRTFGMPGGLGYLGVCFGPLITANSPATTAQFPANWEAVLWHEFCHTITLEKTNNRMPRWLSEGISVYEEMLKNPAWGQSMNPEYRRMILEQDALTPISSLSEAFLKPKTQMDLQFAYFQSSMVVRFLVEEFGLEKLLETLEALGRGDRIGHALEMVYGDVSELESRFEAQAFELARNMGSRADWQVFEEDEWPELDAENQVWDAWFNQRPKHYETLRRSAIRAIKQGDWAQAKSHTVEMIELFPNETGPQCGRALLSQVHRGLNDVESEIKTLQDWAQIDAEAIAAYERLMDLGLQTKQPELTLNAAQKFLAVDPFRDAPYAMSALAYEILDEKPSAANQLIKRLELDPTNPSRIEFQIASHLAESDTQQAKYYVLKSLEDAPRFRDGLKLLLKINRKENPITEDDPTESSDQGSNPDSAAGPEKARDAIQSEIPEDSSDGI